MSSFASLTSLNIWKNVILSSPAPDIVMAPLVEVTNTSVASPCESSVTTTAVPNAASASALSPTLIACNPQAIPVVAAIPTQNALNVTVPPFQDFGNATVNCANSSESLSKSNTFNLNM